MSQLIAAWHFRALTWDDSAITLAFSRTLVMTGRVEPTAGSGIVEGYSSTLWMLLMAALAEFLRNPTRLLEAAKLTSLALNITNLFLIRQWFRSWNTEMFGNLVAGVVGCDLMFWESINGMETPLILTLVLILSLLIRERTGAARILYLALGVALVLTRFEALWLLLPFMISERPASRSIQSAIVWSGTFAISEVIRLLYFGQALPNTIVAKMGSPYTYAGWEEVWRHLVEVIGIALFALPFVAILSAFVISDRRRSPEPRVCLPAETHSRESLRLCVLFSLFTLALAFVIGRNWGPPLRSFYPGWPFLLGLVFFPMLRADRDSATRQRQLAVFAICVLAVLHMSVLWRDLSSRNAIVYATVDDIDTTRIALHELQEASHQRDLLFAGPDMGAVALYSDNVRVIDLGLLCSSELARDRYAGIRPYVLSRRPDAIEVHSLWTVLTRPDQYPEFTSGYVPVYANGIRVFVARRLISRLQAGQLQQFWFTPTGFPLQWDLTTPRDSEADHQLNRLFRTYYILHQPQS